MGRFFARFLDEQRNSDRPLERQLEAGTVPASPAGRPGERAAARVPRCEQAGPGSGCGRAGVAPVAAERVRPLRLTVVATPPPLAAEGCAERYE